MSEAKYTAEEEATRLGVQLIECYQIARPGYKHLQIVLCKRKDEHEPYITWLFNKECGGFHHGDYCKSLLEAVDSFYYRCKRYEADK